MKNKILDYRAGIVAGLLFFLAAAGACADDDDIAPAFQGHWTGNARIIVTWCRQTNLSLALDIHSDGTVAGKVGDARLKSGRFERNRGWWAVLSTSRPTTSSTAACKARLLRRKESRGRTSAFR